MKAVQSWTMVIMAAAAMMLVYGGVAWADHRVSKMSKYNFSDTLSKIKGAIEAEGFKIVAVIDHQASLKQAGVTWQPWVVIEFFSEKHAKEILHTDPSADLDVPLRISVMDGDPKDPHGKEPHASYYKPSGLFAEYKKLRKVSKDLDAIFDKIVSGVAAPAAARGH